MNPDAPHYVYRLFDADDGLLYVGCTHDLTMRMRYHHYRTSWIGEVTRTVVETHPDRRAALLAERAAIVLERPRYNKTHIGWAPEQVAAIVAATVKTAPAKPSGLAGQDEPECEAGIMTAAPQLELFDRLADLKTQAWAAVREHRPKDFLALASTLEAECEEYRAEHHPDAREVFVVCDRAIGQPLSVYARTADDHVLLYEEARR